MGSNKEMKVLYGIFFVLAIIFCIVGVMGHTMAWSAASLCFFAATMIIVNQRKNK